MLQEEELKGAPVLILANKQDMPNAMNELEVSKYSNYDLYFILYIF